MLNLKPYSATLLAFGGILLTVMGIYFFFVRPALLPEDLHYMKTTLSNVKDKIPDLQVWLQKVFWVLGGYIFTTGLLTIYVAQTSFRARTKGSFSIIFLSGISSLGTMAIVNFLINSDFKWVLLLFSLPWSLSLILYRLHK